MTTTSTKTNFNFRTKFKKLLNDENILVITKAFENFCIHSSTVARDILWRMTYSTDSAYQEIYNLGLNQKNIPTEKILLFRNELRYQYEQKYSNFLKLNSEGELEEVYSTLMNKTDSIVANVVYNRCYLERNSSEINRILFLLQSEKEQNYFGGIRSLNFNIKETEYLKLYHTEIHNLLQATYIAFNSEEFDELPFYMGEEESIEEIGENLISEESVDNSSVYKILTPEEILMHKDIFKSFAEKGDLNLLIPIGQLGVDLNEVSSKKEEIYNFIKAADALMK